MIRIPKPVNAVLDWVGDRVVSPLRSHWQQAAIITALLAVVTLIVVQGPSAGLVALGFMVCVIAGAWIPQAQVQRLREENAELEREKGRLAHANRVLADQVETDQVLTEKLWVIPHDGGDL